MVMRSCRRSCGFWMLMMMMMMMLVIGGSGGCIEEERKSLLQFKAAWMQAGGILDTFMTSSWVDEDHDCCGWEGVTCDPVTGHVLQLDLDYILIRETDFESLNMELIGTGIQKLSTLQQLENLDFSFNYLEANVLSSLSTLKSLKILDLSGNSLFQHDFSSKECETLSRLTKLERLSFLFNGGYEANEINISCLGSLSSLRSLSLSQNNLSKLLGLESLQNIKELDLSYCDISNKDIEKLSALKQLESLHIRENHLNASAFTYVSAIKSLKLLDLSYNNLFVDGFSSQVLESLQQIEELDLSFCSLTSKGGGVIRSFSKKMVKLRNLDLSWNNLEKDVLVTLGALPSLQSLNLTGNPFIEGPLTNQDLIGFHHLEILNLDSCGLNGTLPSQSLCKMNKLQELDLSNNLFEGDIPTCLNKLSFLKYFSVYKNQLSGNISSSLFRDLNFLEYIDLRDNSLQGSLSLRTFANFSKLGDVLISSYGDKLVIENDEVDWVPKFQLKALVLSNCKLKEFPKFLLYQKHLRYLNLSHNKIQGSFPNWLLVNNTELSFVTMRDNNIGGNMFSNLFNWSTIRRGGYMDFMDISNNKMSGQIPKTSTNRSTVDVLMMRGNSFSGPFPCHLVGFDYLDIAYNSFSGELPACSTFQSMSGLNLYGNKFTGSVPETILNSTEFVTLDIGNNFFSGRIPTNFTNLQVLSLRGNRFSGAIPHELCQMKRLNWLDLSHNSFSGSIPPCLGNNISFGEYTYTLGGGFIEELEDAQSLQSPLLFDYKAYVLILTKYRVDSYSGKSLELMSGLDLSSNDLEGEIPIGLGNLSAMRALNLSHNWLSGPIPLTFSNLKQIESLDLSHNNLSGEIPSNLVNLNFMGTFSVAYNNLSGRLPDMKGQFATFTENSYAGNPFLLCGPPLEKGCKVMTDDNEDDEMHDHETWYTIDREELFASFMATYIVYILGFITVLWINTRWRNMWFNFIENILFSSYYFLSDALYKCFRVRI